MRLSDAGLATIARLKSLQHLDLESCSKITDVGLAAVVEGCPHLVKLTLTGCRGLYGGPLKNINRGLKYLDLTDCSKVHQSFTHHGLYLLINLES